MAIDQNMQSIPKNTYTSLNIMAKIVAGVFFAYLVLAVVGFVFDEAQASLLNQVIGGGYVSDAEATVNDLRQALIGLVQLVVFIATAVVFLIWIYLASRNLRSFHAVDVRFTPGWAVGWFFVPFMNLFRPYQVIKEIWEESDPDTRTDPSMPYKPSSTAMVGWWWALYLVGNYVSYFAGTSILRGDTAEELLSATRFYQASAAIDIAGIIITIWMVMKITQFQEMKYKQIPAPQPEASFGSLQY